MACPPWQHDLSRAFKRHRAGRSGWYLQVHGDRLRLVSRELPARPGEPPAAGPKQRALTLSTPPSPSTVAAALAEACGVFDAVMAGRWSWPHPDAALAGDDPGHLQHSHLRRLARQLREQLVGEQMQSGTWERTWQPYLTRLAATAEERNWADDETFLAAFLRGWPPNSRSRQMAYDRARRLWKAAAWSWPEALAPLRGNGKAAAAPQGVRSFSDAEIEQLRAAIHQSRLTAADGVAWDCMIVFGLRPKELQALELQHREGVLVAVVSRSKQTSRSSSGARIIPAVPPAGWPADCHRLLDRWRCHGLPRALMTARSPGQALTQQLRRLHLPEELTSYGLRHAFALRLGLELGLHVREAAELMGHSPAVHLATYGRRLDGPALLTKVARFLSFRLTDIQLRPASSEESCKKSVPRR